ncbi:MAG: mycobactin polyketide synthase MbtD [Mycobacterium sp.]
MSPLTFPDGRVPVLLSAHDEDLIKGDAEVILRYLDRSPGVESVAATLLRTRRTRRHRTVIRATDRTELADGLRAIAAGREHPLVARSSESACSRLAFVFPGQGTQWPGMGAQAYDRLPAYRAEADRCAAAFAEHGGASPLPYLTGECGAQTFSQIETQGAQFTHAVALAEVWRNCGVRPDITVGHSLGEIGAAYVAEMISLPDAVAAVAARAHVVDLLPGTYGMTVLGISAAEAQELIAATDGWLELSAVNSDSSVVVSGDRDAVTAITDTVDGRGQLARQIAVDYPGHTSALEPLRDELRSRLPRTRFTDAPIQFIGSTTVAVVDANTDFADYWCENLRNTVRFDRAIDSALGGGAGAFIEMSAHPSLLYALADLADDAAVLAGSGRRDEPLTEVLSANIAAAAVTDPGYRWTDLVDVSQRPLSEFPNAPMKAVHMWVVPDPLPPPPKLTIALETWVHTSLPALAVSLSTRRIAVLDRGADTALCTTLRAAIERYPGVSAAPAADADTLVVVAPPLDQSDAVRAIDDLAASVGAGLLNYVDAIGPRCREVWLVTAGGEQVRPGESVPLPAQAALAAMHRSIGLEHPDQTFRHLDLPTWDEATVPLETIIDALLTDTSEVALRESAAGPVLYRREVREQVRGELSAPRWPLESGVLDNVVIAGGTGAIGLHYARYLAERGAGRIVLLGRRGVDEAVLDELRNGSDTEIIAVPCDLTDSDHVSAVAAEFAADGASLLIHAAGTATLATRERINAASLIANTAAKTVGLSHVVDTWPLKSDARILLCSSVIGVWGGKGGAAYAAANRILDVTAGQLRAMGLRCFAVRWGLWEGRGIVDDAEAARVERAGLRPMPAVPAIEASLFDYPVDPLVLAADADRLRMFVSSQGATDPEPTAATAPADNRQIVTAELAAVLNVAGAALDLDASLFDLGVDSLLAIDLRKRIKRVTGRSIPLATLLSGLTGSELIARLGQKVERRP